MIYSPRRHKEHTEGFYLADREMSIGQMRSPWGCIPIPPTSNVLQMHMPWGDLAATKNTESVPICRNLPANEKCFSLRVLCDSVV